MQQIFDISVVMITYNHESFIKAAMEAVIEQNGDFSIEFIICNDASTDNTHQIISRIMAKEYPRITFRYFNHQTNLGIMSNFRFALEKATGLYVALCEGDDFWSNKNKLLKQYNFLSKHPDYVIHSGAARTVTESGNELGYIGNYGGDFTFDITDFYCKNNMVSCTVMFKNTILQFPKYFNSIKFGDWFLYAMLLKQSNKKAYRSKEILASYRINSQGVMSSIEDDKIFEENLKQAVRLKTYIGYDSLEKKHVVKLNFTLKKLGVYYFKTFQPMAFFNSLISYLNLRYF